MSWSVARDPALDPVSPGARPDFTLTYGYARWRPTLYAQFQDETTPLLLPSADGSSVEAVALRQQSVDMGAFLPFLRVRQAQQIFGAYHLEHDRAESAAAVGTLDRGAVRLGWSFTNAKRYGYSISRESGVAAGVVSELGGAALGGDGTSTLVRADVRGFVPMGPRHAMLAVRGAAAASGGDTGIRRILRLGGTDGDPSVVSFDDDGTSLLRGFPSNAFRGTRVGLVNVEYRMPIAWIERGRGTWPAFVRNLHVALVPGRRRRLDAPRKSLRCESVVGRRNRERRGRRIRSSADADCRRRVGTRRRRPLPRYAADLRQAWIRILNWALGTC